MTSRMLGEKLRDARTSRGLSLSDVAERAEISPATLSRIERDKQALDIGLFLNLTKILKAPAHEFFEKDGNGAAEGTDPLASKIASMKSRERTAMWRELSTQVARTRAPKTDMRRMSIIIEELLAHVELLRSEIDAVRKELRRHGATSSEPTTSSAPRSLRGRKAHNEE